MSYAISLFCNPYFGFQAFFLLKRHTRQIVKLILQKSYRYLYNIYMDRECGTCQRISEYRRSIRRERRTGAVFPSHILLVHLTVELFAI